MRKLEVVLSAVLAIFLHGIALGQEKPATGAESQAQSSPQQKTDGRQYSGMYAFLKDGEFVQVTVEDDGRVTGFISRYGGDKGAFVDHFFKSGALEGNKLSFTTKAVSGLALDFKGTVERGAGKDPGDEAYYVLKGTLTENLTGADKKITSSSREVELKIFPQEPGGKK